MRKQHGQGTDPALTCRWRKASFEERNKNALALLQHHLLVQPRLHISCLVGTASVSLVEEDPSKMQMMAGQGLMVDSLHLEETPALV